MQELISPKQPSKSQCEQFISLTGYEYPQGTIEGWFKTDRPYNDHEWNLSPWDVRYLFNENEKKLFCELSHRMTNNRCHGWDHEGNPLPSEEVEKVYPSYLF